jgi:hypothetical protein
MKTPQAKATRDDPGSNPIAPPVLDCFRLEPSACKLVPGKPQRQWMDDSAGRFAYRCLPLLMANCTGWDVILPFSFEAEWNGGDGVDAIEVRTRATRAEVEPRIASHFGGGVLTFHTGWLFRTSPGWALRASGPPNAGKDGVTALEGLVESDWLPFPFTMNWRFTRPGVVSFKSGESFCFISPYPHGWIDQLRPSLHEIGDDPALAAAYRAWSDSRNAFNAGLREGDKEIVAEGWQRAYAHGRDGGESLTYHRTKRRLATPK